MYFGYFFIIFLSLPAAPPVPPPPSYALGWALACSPRPPAPPPALNDVARQRNPLVKKNDLCPPPPQFFQHRSDLVAPCPPLPCLALVFPAPALFTCPVLRSSNASCPRHAFRLVFPASKYTGVRSRDQATPGSVRLRGPVRARSREGCAMRNCRQVAVGAASAQPSGRPRRPTPGGQAADQWPPSRPKSRWMWIEGSNGGLRAYIEPPGRYGTAATVRWGEEGEAASAWARPGGCAGGRARAGGCGSS